MPLFTRLGDFKDTASSQLTIEEFLKIDLDQEHDPPCFLESKRKKLKQVSLFPVDLTAERSHKSVPSGPYSREISQAHFHRME